MIEWKLLEEQHGIKATLAKLLLERHLLKKHGEYIEADEIRRSLVNLGFIINDTKSGYTLTGPHCLDIIIKETNP